MTEASHVVVDGSNIATEGRSIPSLAQLEGAVQELRKEMPGSEVIVVVDATFAHRIDASERPHFEQAALRGEYVYPPAGAIGGGDAFLLRIAQKIDATVLSNDSFQEFHGEHEWLFEKGRLIGGTPVPGVGWIFVARTPVRGPKSRIAVRDADREKSKVEKAIAAATKEAVAPETARGGRKGKKKAEEVGDGNARQATPRAVNDPLTFISFVADHPLGSVVEGEVDSFTSHGAIVLVGEMHCYVPLSGLGDPPPRSAREVLRRDEQRTFVLTALDPQRRGVELALPEAAVVSGHPTEETVEAEVAMTLAKPRRSRKPAATPSSEAPAAETAQAPSRRGRKPAAGSASPEPPPVEPSPATSRRRRNAPAPAPAPPAPAQQQLVEQAAAPSRRGRRAAVTPDPEPEVGTPSAARRARKAPPAPAKAPEAPAGAPARRARKAPDRPVAEVEPAATGPVRRTRKAPAGPQPQPQPARKPAGRPRTAATAKAEPGPAAKPARATRKAAGSPKAADAPKAAAKAGGAASAPTGTTARTPARKAPARTPK